MIKRAILTGLFCSLLASPVAASNIDQVYTKQSRQTWGQWFKGLFQRSDFNKSYAVVIGVSQFDDFQNLGTANDPVRMKDYLLNEAGFDYVRLITGKQVNLNKIRSIMVDEMPRMLNPNDRFVFYWSGHGATDSVNGKQFGYLPVANSQRGAFSSMLSMNDLSGWDSRLRAKQTLYLLDACFSGLAGYQVKSDGREQTLQQIARPSRQILTAGLANEETIVINRLGGSVFTTALLDGLRGEADTESGPFQKDGIVSARELELYVKRRVGSEVAKSGWNRSITPLLTRLNHREGDFFFFSERTVAAAPAGSVVQVARSQVESGVVAMSANQQQPAPPRQQASAANQKVIRLPNNLNLVRIPAGSFQMGSNNEKLVHTVSIPRPFYMSQTEITFAQYDAYATATGEAKPKDEGWGRGNRPVINVSWNDARGYAKWFSASNGQGLQCRLPSEAEWEYSARAGTVTVYPWGVKPSYNYANYGANRTSTLIKDLQEGIGVSAEKFFSESYNDETKILVKGHDKWPYTAPTGSFPPNGFGLKDMHGNVSEWTNECWNINQKDPNSLITRLAQSKGNCNFSALRGGDWSTGADLETLSGSSASTMMARFAYGNNIGFRVVCFSSSDG